NAPAAELFAGLARDFPGTPQHQVQVSAAHHNRAGILKQLGRLAEAEAGYQAAQSAMAAVPEEVRNLPRMRLDQGNTWMHLGSVYGQMRRFDEGEKAMREAIAIDAVLAEK